MSRLNLKFEQFTLGGAIHLHYPFVKAEIREDVCGGYQLHIEYTLNGILYKMFNTNTESEAIDIAKSECVKLTTKAQTELWQKINQNQ
jgi:hypothetical protein|tara:strand:- start:2832 stop:3095 length:264 start_codon:yes stop_codon:yes gene_type:complete